MKTVDELLQRGRQVTDNYLKVTKKWTMAEQLLHIYEEVGELQRAGNGLEMLEEGSDVIYAVLTYWHLYGADDYAIQMSLESTMRKIEERSKSALHSSETSKESSE